MDLSNRQRAISTLTTAQEQSSNSSMMVPSKRDIFLSTYRRQSFTLPESVIYFIAKNPKNTKVYQKMVQSCKNFFVKNPILILSNLNYNRECWIYGNGFRKFNMKNISSKLWIICNFHVYSVNYSNKTVASSIIPKIYQCDSKNVYLDYQIIPLTEFLFLCSSAEVFDLYQFTVKNEDGTIVSFEKLIKQLPNVKSIRYFFTTPSNNTTKETFKDLWKIPHLSNYNNFKLNNIPEDFDIDSFYSFMKKNKSTYVRLSFSETISEEYKTRLEAFIDQIIETKNHEYKPPLIAYPGIDEGKYWKLYRFFSPVFQEFF